ncbi:MAG: RimJ/RimL family protein N-acetyltransferase [Bacteriovoracaceae bacterium]|jgi:RimJ/RimL family protein N-acetyltransferase
MNPYLETDRIRLLNFTEEDKELVRELDSDPDVVRFISDGIPSDETEVNRAMGIFLSYNKKFNQKFGFWKAINKENNDFMGWFHFRPLKSDPENFEVIELGYRLRKKYWGIGIATEGSKALVDKGFNELGVKEVRAHAMLKNIASTHVMKKVGLVFSHEEIYEPWPGSDKECVWYSLKR